MSSVIDRIEKIEQTLTELNAKSSAFTTRVETVKIDMMESPFLIQTRARINGIINSLENTGGGIQNNYDPRVADLVLALHRKLRTKPTLCDQLEILLKEEAEEVKYLHRLRMDHQHQLAMACQSQGQSQDGVAVGLEQLAKATSQLAASIASGKSLATIEAKPEILLSEHSATVSRTDKAAIPGPAVNKSLESLSSVSPQAPRRLEREGTSMYLVRLQGKIELVRELLYNAIINDGRPRIEQLSEKAIDDPEILMLWTRTVA
ncbi:hypothetical protein BG011_005069 [Mortierella polycephala]|uniref:Uncharacterized protein n=1 Tax=Mortierella polycephala TaxID=41804 RepID=A0A9P6PY63_9FUNG|nr:hypothetical protein BG011_005069 [Mortierella polycephala]